MSQIGNTVPLDRHTYEDPFLDMAATKLPKSFKKLLELCQIFAMTHPQISPIIQRLAEYAITSLVYKSDNEESERQHKELFEEHLRILEKLIEVGLDYFCLSGDTDVPTRDGVHKIRDLVGETVDVLSSEGVYRPAEFKSYGVQELYEVEFGHDEKLVATAEHEWPVIDTNQKRKKLRTTELVGKFLIRNVAPRPEKNEDFWRGVHHGIVYGDGTLSNEGRQAHVILYPGKEELGDCFRKFPEYTVTPHHENKYLGVYGLPPSYKTSLPDNEAPASYWYGFVCGFMSTDGCCGIRGESVLTQHDPASLHAIRRQLSRIGMVGGQVRDYIGSGYMGDDYPMSYLTLQKSFMVPEDFLRSHHKENFEREWKGPAYGRKMRVKSVRCLERSEEVFCCVESETHTFTVDNGILTGNCYGNCFASISFPFIRLYRCQVCGHDHQTSELVYRYVGGRFDGVCKKCGGERTFVPIDQYVQNKEGINIFRFEPQLMTPKYNRVTGQYFYYYDIPPDLKRAIQVGDRDIIDSTPVEYLKCIQMRRKMKIKRIYHFKRPTFSGRDMQWGFPLVLPALKDAYLNAIYKKSDEAVALEHSVPLRVLYPDARTQDPMQKLALGNFKTFMSRNIKYWRRDKNAIITSPMPIGVTNIGGDASTYSTINARVKVVDEIMGAMMVTRGFVMGGENWSSQSISQRVMENSFLNYLRRMDGFLQWVRDEVSAFLNMPPCAVSMKPFKKIDDVQMLNLVIGLAREKRISWEEALSRMDLDSAEELKLIEKETAKYAKLMLQELLAQNEASAKALVAQTLAQQETEGIQQVHQNMVQRSDAILEEVKGTAKRDEAAQVQGQQQAEQMQQNPQMQMMGARAAKDGAKAEKDKALASKLRGDKQEVMVNLDIGKQIALWASELLRVDEKNRARLLTAMHHENPEIAKAVVEVAQQLEAGGQARPRGGAMGPTQDPQAMLMAITQQAKSPDELAQKMQMIEPGQQRAILLQLQRSNPTLFNLVMMKMNALGQAGGGNGVDMRPLPEQRPPRREEKSV